MLGALKTRLPAHLDKVPDPSPHAVVGQLPPSPGVRHISLIKYASQEIDDESDYDNYEEHSGGAYTLLGGLGTCARIARAELKEVGALVRVGADKRC